VAGSNHIVLIKGAFLKQGSFINVYVKFSDPFKDFIETCQKKKRTGGCIPYSLSKPKGVLEQI
jgi:hypothetical protein